jgi:hypothetical protein
VIESQVANVKRGNENIAAIRIERSARNVIGERKGKKNANDVRGVESGVRTNVSDGIMIDAKGTATGGILIEEVRSAWIVAEGGLGLIIAETAEESRIGTKCFRI